MRHFTLALCVVGVFLIANAFAAQPAHEDEAPGRTPEIISSLSLFTDE